MVNVVVKKIDEQAIAEYIKKNLKLEVHSYGSGGNTCSFELELSLEGHSISHKKVDIYFPPAIISTSTSIASVTTYK